MGRKRKSRKSNETMSKTMRGFMQGFMYWLSAGALIGIFGIAANILQPVMKFTINGTTYDFGFIVGLAGLGFGAFLLFRGAREIGIKL